MANNSTEEIRPYIDDVLISDIEKKKVQKNKFYVYVITVHWSDGKKNVICRRYSRFFNLQTSLIDTFTEESGVKDPSKRILPFIPGKVLFGRSQVREVALKRKQHLNDYVQELIKLPAHISRCDLILDFFEATQEDIENLLGDAPARKKSVKTADNISDPVMLEQYIVVANFKKTERTQISLAEGDTVDVIERHENGWWFVCLEDEQGWVPSSYLDPADGLDDEDENNNDDEEPNEPFICVRKYKAVLPDELTIDLGDVVEVIKRNRDGWWEVKLRHEGVSSDTGFVPYAHLKKVPKSAEESLKLKTRPSPKERGFAAPPRKKTIRRKNTNAPVPIQRPSSVHIPPVAAKRPPITPITHDDEIKFPSPVQRENKPSFAHTDSLEKNNVTEDGGDGEEEDEVIYVCIESILSTADNSFHVEEGAQMKILEKSPNGWWYVKVGKEEGWVPSTYAQRKRRQLNKKAEDKKDSKLMYEAIEDYLASSEEMISFGCGQKIEVLEKHDEGWWYVNINGKEGWAPSTYLKEIRKPVKRPVAKPKSPSPASDKNRPPSRANKKNSNSSNPEIKNRPPSRESSSSSNSDIVLPPRTNTAVKKRIPNDPTSPPARKEKPVVSKTIRKESVEVKEKPSLPPRVSSKSETTTKSNQKEADTFFRPVPNRNTKKKKGVPLNRIPPERPASPNVNKTSRRNPKSLVKSESGSDSNNNNNTKYIALATYADADPGMLNFDKGDMLEILEKDDGGWWLAKLNDQTGWVPSNFIKFKS